MTTTEAAGRRASASPITIKIALDAVAIERAASALRSVQETRPDADLPYVLTGAATIGLRRVKSRRPGPDLDAAFSPSTGAEQELEIALTPEDAEEAQQASEARALPLKVIVRAAVVCGLAALTGNAPGFKIGASRLGGTLSGGERA